jgi:gas vesicle protein
MMKLFRRKKQVKKEEKAKSYGKEALDALANLSKELSKDTVKQSSEKFYNIVKRFFSEYFSMRYEFTHDELEKDLKKKRKVDDKVKEQVLAFSNELSDMKYKSKDISVDQIEDSIKDFTGIVSALVDKRKAEPVQEQVRRLKGFVKFALEKGKSKEQIEEALLNAGWPESVIKRELEKIEE